MQIPDEKSQMCERCQERPATERYTLATDEKSVSEVICPRCYDMPVAFAAIQFDAVLFDLHVREQQPDLRTRELYDAMLARLDKILAANRHRDHDGRLIRSVTLARADILCTAE